MYHMILGELTLVGNVIPQWLVIQKLKNGDQPL